MKNEYTAPKAEILKLISLGDTCLNMSNGTVPDIEGSDDDGADTID